jgi:hypothetical protein
MVRQYLALKVPNLASVVLAALAASVVLAAPAAPPILTVIVVIQCPAQSLIALRYILQMKSLTNVIPPLRLPATQPVNRMIPKAIGLVMISTGMKLTQGEALILRRELNGITALNNLVTVTT